jgi:hypothetical protein
MVELSFKQIVILSEAKDPMQVRADTGFARNFYHGLVRRVFASQT